MSTAAPPQPQSPSPSAVRMARHRARRKRGLHGLTIFLHEREIDALIRRGWLAAESRADRDAIRKALYRFVGDMLR
jgi:hypothetical protein